MKTLKDITVNLKLAKELKEVGFPQEDSLFYWVKQDENDGKYLGDMGMYREWQVISRTKKLIVVDKPKYWEIYSAPTAEELLEWLPERIEHGGKFYFLTFWKRQSGEIAVKYKPNEGGSYLPVQFGKLHTALAKMVIYLAKNKIINFER